MKTHYDDPVSAFHVLCDDPAATLITSNPYAVTCWECCELIRIRRQMESLLNGEEA